MTQRDPSAAGGVLCGHCGNDDPAGFLVYWPAWLHLGDLTQADDVAVDPAPGDAATVECRCGERANLATLRLNAKLAAEQAAADADGAEEDDADDADDGVIAGDADEDEDEEDDGAFDDDDDNGEA